MLMKIAVVSYSLTGNNDTLAVRVAASLSADHIRVKDKKKRTMGTISLDMLFNRTPQVIPAPESIGDYDLLVLAGPVWMGMAASPLRAYLKGLKKNQGKYAFFSISGGTDNPNPQLPDDLKKRAGSAPAVFVDQHIAELLRARGLNPTRQDTQDYQLTEEDLRNLTAAVVAALKTLISQMNAEELAHSGIKPGTIRLSVGTEHIDDIIADLQQAFEKTFG
jgi:flavodoxin